LLSETSSLDAFASAQTAADNWLQAVAECVAQLSPLPRGANLGFVYATDAFSPELRSIVRYLRDALGVGQWVGSVGVGICAVGREYYETPALSVMVGAFPPDSFRVFNTVSEGLDRFIAENGEWFMAKQTRFGVVHGDPRNRRLPQLITRLAAAVNDGFLVGGLTSTRSTYTQVSGDVTEGGLSGVLFAPEVPVATTLTQSCAPFGAPHEITQCQDNIIMTLDGRPALDVFYDEIGDILSRDLNKAARYIAAALLVPGSDTRDYLVRNLVGVDPRTRLLAIGEMVQPGQVLQFCRRDPANAMKDMQRMLRELKGRIPNPPRGAIYYSCLGRGRYMFGEGSEELKAIQREFGDVPLTGFFCNGEICHNRLYGYTGVLTLFL
jgi:small ligand-binding sensory domain FIST